MNSKLNELKTQLLQLRYSDLEAVEKARQMGEVVIKLKQEVKKQGMVWHTYMRVELGMAPATLYNAERIAICWDYIKWVKPRSLKHAISLVYPESQLSYKLHQYAAENMKVLWTSA